MFEDTTKANPEGRVVKKPIPKVDPGQGNQGKNRRRDMFFPYYEQVRTKVVGPHCRTPQAVPTKTQKWMQGTGGELRTA